MPFSTDYFTARERFRHSLEHRATVVQSIPSAARGPRGEELTMDVARLGPPQPESMLVLTSGLHGCEGLFGSAVQVAALEKLAQSPPPAGVGVLLIHALNPYGFAWMRRTNEDNVDLNRNFLLPGQQYADSPPLYRELNKLVNPERPPSRWEPFRLAAYWLILRHGLSALMQAIAGGQYEFPRGLFYGGSGPSETMRILQEQLPCWLAGTSHVLHLDFHTGLGRRGSYKLLTDDPLSVAQSACMRQHFGADAVEEYTPPDTTPPATLPSPAGTASSSKTVQNTAYATRGSLGHWCAGTFPEKDYTYLCAEFGTYPPLAVIGGLRAENQTHFWDKPESATTRRAKERLQELLNPASPAWRREVIQKSMALMDQAFQVLVS